jgi:hypothetical protein
MAGKEKGSAMGSSYDDEPSTESQGEQATEAGSLAARRARLRGSLAKAGSQPPRSASLNTGKKPDIDFGDEPSEPAVKEATSKKPAIDFGDEPSEAAAKPPTSKKADIDFDDEPSEPAVKTPISKKPTMDFDDETGEAAEAPLSKKPSIDFGDRVPRKMPNIDFAQEETEAEPGASGASDLKFAQEEKPAASLRSGASSVPKPKSSFFAVTPDMVPPPPPVKAQAEPAAAAKNLSEAVPDEALEILHNIEGSLSTCVKKLEVLGADKSTELIKTIENALSDLSSQNNNEEMIELLTDISKSSNNEEMIELLTNLSKSANNEEMIELLTNIDKTMNTCATSLKAFKPDKSVGLLSDIDEVLNACATNLSALQKVATEQVDMLNKLTDTLKNQTLHEIGMNLTSLTESMATAIEPMKAVGELVPVIDQLVAAIEAREAGRADEITADQLVMNLADQLAVGAIDPWTFKCAYMAVFPEDHPADLLRRLVELLGTQRLSGDLFRAAYEAVQAASPPASYSAQLAPRQRQAVSAPDEDLVGAMVTEEIRSEMAALHDANEELRRAMDEREEEFEQLLNAKEQELKEVHEQLAERYEEFNERYEELTNSLKKREDEYQALLANKDLALSEKESETSLLRGQIEELRMQFEEFGRETRKQSSQIKQAVEEAKQAQPAPAKPAEYASFFDTAPTRPGPASEFKHPSEEPAPQQAELQGAPQPVAAELQAPQPQAQPQPQVVPQPQVPPQPQVQAAPDTAQAQQSTFAGAPQAQQRTTGSFASGTGSYGSGVRAQVFEVIVRQALAGAPWREICAAPMQVNNISAEEVEAEVKRRQSLLGK